MPSHSYEPINPEPTVFTTGMGHAEIDRITESLNPSELIHFWGTFQARPDLLFPSATTQRPVDDVAAVMAGSKPATVMISEDLSDPLVVRLVEEEKDRFDTLSRSYAIDHYGGIKYFLGREENVKTLAEQYEGRGGDDSPKKADESFHRAVGEALGYPAEAIDAFVAGILASEERAKQKGRLARVAGWLTTRG